MANTTSWIFGNTDGPPTQRGLDDVSGVEPDAVAHSTGILPSQGLEYLVKATREIVAVEPIQEDQYQPASLDLRLGPIAYRVRASFLPGKNATVKQRLEDLAMHELDIGNGGGLSSGCVFLLHRA